MNALTDLLQEHELFHSEFQIRNMIIARTGGTLYGAYRQALRELWQRVRGIGSIITEVTNSEIAAPPETNCPTVVAARSLQVRDTFGRIATLRDALRECTIVFQLAQSLRVALGSIDVIRRKQLENELWVHRVRSAIAVDFITVGRPGAQSVELLHALPIELREPIIQEILDPLRHEALVHWYLRFSLQLPETTPPDEAQKNRILQWIEEATRVAEQQEASVYVAGRGEKMQKNSLIDRSDGLEEYLLDVHTPSRR